MNDVEKLSLTKRKQLSWKSAVCGLIVAPIVGFIKTNIAFYLFKAMIIVSATLALTRTQINADSR